MKHPAMVVTSFFIGVTLLGIVLHLIRRTLMRDEHPSFRVSVFLAIGLKVAGFLIVAFLAGILGPFVLAPVFFASWAILARYGGLSEKQAALAVCLLVGLESVWLALGIS
ncbi:MAG: hypothetical protein ACYTHK_02820 [Planctomycetota bacterium]|jgi:hypothetical protein